MPKNVWKIFEIMTASQMDLLKVGWKDTDETIASGPTICHLKEECRVLKDLEGVEADE